MISTNILLMSIKRMYEMIITKRVSLQKHNKTSSNTGTGKSQLKNCFGQQSPRLAP
jgi:hypothetical protein